MQYQTKSAEETKKVAAKIAQNFRNRGGIITLSGDLGAGKTTFVQGFAKALGIRGKIISPTFIITRQYPIPNSNRLLYHIDLYRLEQLQELESLGLSEIFQNLENIILMEWPERLGNITSLVSVQIKIKLVTKNHRIIDIV